MAGIMFHTVHSVFEQQRLIECDTVNTAFLEEYTALIFRVYNTIKVKAAWLSEATVRTF